MQLVCKASKVVFLTTYHILSMSLVQRDEKTEYVSHSKSSKLQMSISFGRSLTFMLKRSNPFLATSSLTPSVHSQKSVRENSVDSNLKMTHQSETGGEGRLCQPVSVPIPTYPLSHTDDRITQTTWYRRWKEICAIFRYASESPHS